MRLLAQQAQVLEPLAIRARRDHEFDAHQQAAAANIPDVGMADLSQLVEQPCAEFRRAVREPFPWITRRAARATAQASGFPP